jgi:hypothetical protein
MSKLNGDNIYIIEDGYNTNYISCLFLSLFLEKTNIYYYMLDNINLPNESVFIQEIIKTIINDFKNYKIINSKIMNYLRNILFFNNFLDSKYIFVNNCIIELYDYLYNIFHIQKIQFMNELKIDSFNYLIFDSYNELDTSIKKLININLPNLILNNIPNFIGIKLIRNHLLTNIDVQKKITFNSIFKENKLIWEIKSIICFDIENSNYFSFVKYKDVWLIINEKLFPPIQKINIRIHENDIKLKSIFLIYNLIQ